GDRQTLHQLRDELLGWQTAKRLVLSRDVQMEAAVRTGDLSFRLEAAESRTRGGVRDPERLRDLVGREQVPPGSSPLPDQIAREASIFRIHATKVTFGGTFVE